LPSTIDRSLVEARRRRIKAQLDDLPGILAKLYAKKDFARVGHNVDLLARALLLRGMTAYRTEQDAKGALADFQAACDLTKEFDRSLKSIRESPPDSRAGYLDIADFEIAMYACLLGCNLERAKTLAALTADPAVQLKEDRVKASMTRLLAALILDDRDRFAALQAEYRRLKKDYWWQQFQHYVDAYGSVMDRDQQAFDKLMDHAEEKFLSRAKDRKFGDLRPEFGGLENNEQVLDFMSLGIAKLAIKRGMLLSKDTATVPRALAERG